MMAKLMKTLELHYPMIQFLIKAYVGMCRCEGYGFQAVYSIIGYINQSVWVYNRVPC